MTELNKAQKEFVAIVEKGIEGVTEPRMDYGDSIFEAWYEVDPEHRTGILPVVSVVFSRTEFLPIDEPGELKMTTEHAIALGFIGVDAVIRAYVTQHKDRPTEFCVDATDYNHMIPQEAAEENGIVIARNTLQLLENDGLLRV